MQENNKTTESGQKDPKKAIKRKLNGVVMSDKMDKTLVVRVNKVIVHPITKKRITHSKRYKVHDELNKFKEGDKIAFKECRPLSKGKRWTVIYN